MVDLAHFAELLDAHTRRAAASRARVRREEREAQRYALLDAAIAKVGTQMKADRTKNRVTVYYLLAEQFKALDSFAPKAKAAAPAKVAKAPVAKPAAPAKKAAAQAN